MKHMDESSISEALSQTHQFVENIEQQFNLLEKTFLALEIEPKLCLNLYRSAELKLKEYKKSEKLEKAALKKQIS